MVPFKASHIVTKRLMNVEKPSRCLTFSMYFIIFVVKTTMP